MALGIVSKETAAPSSEQYKDEDTYSNLTQSARDVYKALLMRPQTVNSQKAARNFLEAQLAVTAERKDCDLPADPGAWGDWVAASSRKVADQYSEYLAARRDGAPRRYFKLRSQALAFITKVAPTKLVDGSWLYGVLRRWTDIGVQPLIRTYLEELGSGDAERNHVSLYKRLLASQGCELADGLDDIYYLQGAVQLALGYNAEQFMPEVIGYNLGYEQLPLHLLISAYELRELAIDSYYFSLHVTIDNASTGHAQQAVQAALESMPADGEEFYRRLRQGYRLNDLGAGSLAIIQSFDLEQELIEVLKRKSRFGQVHSDYCKIDGLTVNQWLADPGQIPLFLDALKNKGWIRTGEDPCNSRFWNLLKGPQAAMFGVFSPYELQLIYDWIGGSWLTECAARRRPEVPVSSDIATPPGARNGGALPPFLHIAGDAERELDGLQAELEELASAVRMDRLIELMAPGKHHKPAGLMATRMFARYWIEENGAV
ncbi:MAG: iron-containing redox enzyme family protein [Porticoccaceae bacterium]